MALAAACGVPPAQASGATIELGPHDAGTTVHVRVGDTVRVSLEDQFPVPGSSLVWTVSSSAPSVLAPSATKESSPRPALGDSPYIAEFTARTAGQATVIANGATTCEAMAKQSCPDREFTIRVIVSS